MSAPSVMLAAAGLDQAPAGAVRSAAEGARAGDAAGAARTPGAAASDAPPAPLEWSWNPWRERPRRATVALAFTLGVWLLLAALGKAPLLATLLGLAVGGTLSPFLVAQRCRIDAERVAVRGAFGWERRAWTPIRRARLGADGVLVSPFARRRRLDAFRALFLPVPAAGRERLLGSLRRHLERHEL